MEISIEATPIEKKSKKPDEWQIKDWCRTICEAEEIKADAEKMKYVKPELEKKIAGMKKAVSSLSDLRTIAKSKTVKTEDDDDEY
jgi:hypothetical protein